MIYNPVKFTLCNNPEGFYLACSDTVLGKEKPNLFALFPALWLLSYTMKLRRVLTCTEAPEPQIPSLFLSWGWVQSPWCQSCPEPGATCGHLCPSWVPAHGSGKLKGWSRTLGRQVLLCPSEQRPSGLCCGAEPEKYLHPAE